MAVLRIAKMGNPVLLKKAAPVPNPAAPEIRQLAADMQETLEDVGASGLAAPQVFVSKRVVVYRIIAARIPAGSGLERRSSVRDASARGEDAQLCRAPSCRYCATGWSVMISA